MRSCGLVCNRKPPPGRAGSTLQLLGRGGKGGGEQAKKFTQVGYLHHSSPAPADKAGIVLHQLVLSILPSALTHGHWASGQGYPPTLSLAGPPARARVTQWSSVVL